MGFDNDDPCSAGSSADATFDAASKTYAGTYVRNTCAGPVSGGLFAARFA